MNPTRLHTARFLRPMGLCLVLFMVGLPLLMAQKPFTRPIGINAQRGDVLRSLRYHDGADSVRYGITALGDTFTVQYFDKEQKLVRQEWHQDSIFQFDTRAIPFAKFFGVRRANFQEFGFNNAFCVADSIVLFAYSGKIFAQHTSQRKAGTYQMRRFDENGAIDFTIQGMVNTDLSSQRRDTTQLPIQYEVRRDYLGRKTAAARRQTLVTQGDTLLIVHTADTTFYTNGQIRTVAVTEPDLPYRLYDERGKLLESVTDSLRLTPFKDNLACLYGFKNRAGDTVIAAQYEHVTVMGDSRTVVQSGSQYQLLRADGSLVATPQASNLELVDKLDWYVSSNNGLTQQNIATSHQDYFWLSFDTGNIYTLASYLTMSNIERIFIPYFSYAVGQKTGIIDRNGVVKMSPQTFADLEWLPQNALVNAFDTQKIGLGARYWLRAVYGKIQS